MLMQKLGRLISELKDKESVRNAVIAYINRLSDYLFTLERKFTYDMDVSEIKWISKKNRSPLLSNSLKNLFLQKFLYLCTGH